MEKDTLLLKKELLSERILRLETQNQLLQNFYVQTKGELVAVEEALKALEAKNEKVPEV